MNWQQLVFNLLVLLIVINGAYYMFTGKFTFFGIDKMLKKILKSLAEGIISLIEGVFLYFGDLISSAIKGIFNLIIPARRKDD